MAAWYIDKFLEFFGRWKKGYIYTKDGKNLYGVVENFVVSDNFEESTITFKSFGTKESGSKELKLLLKDIVYFRAVDGPIFNVGRYLSIIRMQKATEKPVEEKLKQLDNKELVCVAFNIEFYAPKRMARILKKDLKEILFSRVQDLPAVFVKEAKPVELTPSFNALIRRIKGKTA